MHLRQLNVPVSLVSAVGDDRLGYELRRRLNAAGVNLSLLGVNARLETGFVVAELEENGNASYTIFEDVAWDHLPIVPMPTPPSPVAMVYSSLVMRTSHGLSRLSSWLQSAPEAIRIFDINLRAPHYSDSIIQAQMRQAHWIKANYEEACVMTGVFDLSPKELAVKLQSYCHAAVVILTCDADGAGVLIESQWYWQPSPQTTVVDTIGAGDAFLAAFVANALVAKRDIHSSLASAVNRASQVVEHHGGRQQRRRGVSLFLEVRAC